MNRKGVYCMNDLHELDSLPPINKVQIDTINPDSLFIGVAGFEDRCLAFLTEYIKTGKKFHRVIGIKYLPEQKNNLIADFSKLGKCASVDNEIIWFNYNRYDPEEFASFLEFNEHHIHITKNVIVDISGMSKFLILILLDELKKYPVNIDIIYSEAELYYPTEREYRSKKEDFKNNVPPSFLTTNVYRIVTTTNFSSNSMQGYPLLIIAFPTFNYRDTYTLLNSLTPQYLIEIEGVPREDKNLWRKEAIHQINKRLADDFDPNIEGISCKAVSTFKYVETITTLSRCYDEYKYTHKCIIAPTGSKMQALGLFFFKQINPDVHIVYPVTEHFSDLYTKGFKEIWHIRFENFNNIVNGLEKIRKQGIDRLTCKLNNI